MQNTELDRLCRSFGREPAALRRSVIFFGPLDAWADDHVAETLVPRFRQVGMTEFYVMWPDDEVQARRFERFATEVLPELRTSL